MKNSKLNLALGLFEHTNELDLDNFPASDHERIGKLFQEIVNAGLCYRIQSIELEYPSTCDLNSEGKSQRDQLFSLAAK